MTEGEVWDRFSLTRTTTRLDFGNLHRTAAQFKVEMIRNQRSGVRAGMRAW